MDFSIETQRLLLRPFRLEDAKTYYELTSDPDIRRYIPGACMESLEEAIKSISICYSKADWKNDFYLLLEEKHSKRIVGSIQLNKNRYNNYECCYFVSSRERQKGYMKEALGSFLKELPESIKCIQFYIEVDNFPSRLLIEQIDGIIETSYCMFTVYR